MSSLILAHWLGGMKMTSYTKVTKLEVHNILQNYQRRTKPWPQATSKKILWSLAVSFSSCASRKTDRQTTHTTVYGPLGLCPGLSEWAGTRKVKPGRSNQSGFTGARDSEWQWHQLGHTQISLPRPIEITTPAPHHSVFYRPDDLPSSQPTASKHCKQQNKQGLNSRALNCQFNAIPIASSCHSYLWSYWWL